MVRYEHSGNNLVFRTNASDALTIDSSANATLASGNLVIGTSGKGIDFSATSDSAGMTGEVLDDYEEGTWTPTISGYSFTQQVGHYRKIGNLAYVQCFIIVDTRTSGSRVNMGGLPFTSTSHHADGRYPLGVGRWTNLHNNTIALYPFVASNGTTFACDGIAASGDSLSSNLEIFGDDFAASFGGCYHAA